MFLFILFEEIETGLAASTAGMWSSVTDLIRTEDAYQTLRMAAPEVKPKTEFSGTNAKPRKLAE